MLGSFATQRCIDCKTEYPNDLMKKAVESGDVPHCIVPQCNGLVRTHGETKSPIPDIFMSKMWGKVHAPKTLRCLGGNTCCPLHMKFVPDPSKKHFLTPQLSR
jgi:NAD-dependent SIR2 family protein deacetylase